MLLCMCMSVCVYLSVSKITQQVVNGVQTDYDFCKWSDRRKICCADFVAALEGRAVVNLQMRDTFAALQDVNAAVVSIKPTAELLTNRGVIHQASFITSKRCPFYNRHPCGLKLLSSSSSSSSFSMQKRQYISYKNTSCNIITKHKRPRKDYLHFTLQTGLCGG